LPTKTTYDTRDRVTATYVGTGAWFIPETPLSEYPATIPGLEFWGSANYGLYQDAAGTVPVTANSDPVGRWNDMRPGSARFFAQSSNSNRGSFSAMGIGEGPAVRFTKSSSQLLYLQESLFTINPASEGTIFALVKTTSSGSGLQRFLMKASGTDEYSFGLLRSVSDAKFGSLATRTGVSVQYAKDTAATGADVEAAVAFISKEQEIYFYRDGDLISQQEVTLSADANSQGWTVGGELRGGSAIDTSDIEIAQFLIFNRALTEAELNDLFAWAASNPEPEPPPLEPAGEDFRQITALEYDDQCGCSEPKRLIEFVDADSTNNRVTDFAHDYRYRLTATIGEENYCETREYDNVDRVVRIERHLTNPGGRLLMRNDTLFDDRGRVYQTIDYAVDSSGTPGNTLVDNTWYDEARNPIKRLPAGSQAFVKTQFDSRPLPVATFTGYYTESGDEPYAEVGIITGDNKIFEQTATVYDAAGNTIQTSLLRRNHNATGNGTLNPPQAAAQPAARPSYQSLYCDGAGRLKAQANYGTNGDAAFTRPASAPKRSDDVLVISSGYDPAGNRFQTVDPAGREQRQAFNALGKPTLTVSNYIAPDSAAIGQAAESGGSSFDSHASEQQLSTWRGEDRRERQTSAGCCIPTFPWHSCLVPGNTENVTVRMVYNADGNLVRLTACNPTTGEQVTCYEYGVTLANSSVARNDLLRATVYPEAVDGQDRVTYGYNRQGQVTQMTDQNGTVHRYAFDRRGRQTADGVTLPAGSSIDDSILRIDTAYDERDLLGTVTTYDAAESGTVVNQLLRTYNAFRQLEVEYQSHEGSVDTEGPPVTPHVSYGYASGSANTVRPTSLTYPDGRVLTYNYGSSGSDADKLSRIIAIKEGSATLAAYTYFGTSGFAKTDYSQPATAFDLTFGGSTFDPLSGCCDRFDRIIQAVWIKAGSPLAGATYMYDPAGNRVQMQPLGYSATNDLECYEYDGVNRLTHSILGAENELASQETWSLDATGNWRRYGVLNVDDSTINLAQSRESNRANEIVALSRAYGSNWSTPIFDKAGNTVTFPKPLAPMSTSTAVFDGWNRLVRLTDGEAVETYFYDGLTRRLSTDNGVDIQHCYYTRSWKVIEERTNSSTSAERQFIWGLRYLDDEICRDVGSSRVFGLQDANWNTIALVDGSGEVVQRYRYSPFGVPDRRDASGSHDAGADGILWEHLYCGYQYDRICGLYLVRYRYLHPTLGRWLTVDPGIDVVDRYRRYSDGAMAPYAYVHNNPITLLDRFGLYEHDNDQSGSCDAGDDDCKGFMPAGRCTVGCRNVEWTPGFEYRPNARVCDGNSLGQRVTVVGFGTCAADPFFPNPTNAKCCPRTKCKITIAWICSQVWYKPNPDFPATEVINWFETSNRDVCIGPRLVQFPPPGYYPYNPDETA
jgi:RHS repeat-associated protein